MRFDPARALVFGAAAALASTGSVHAAQATDPSPIGKVFFADVRGDETYVHEGQRSQLVSAKQTYKAEGLGIETQGESVAAMVFSNGLAVQLNSDSSVVVNRFSQEPFRPNRTDLALEPSISAMALDVVHGTIVLSTSKLAAGSLLTVFTPVASITIQGGTMIISADSEHTDVSMLSGTGTIYSRIDSTRFAVVRDGQLATAHRAIAPPSNDVTIEVARLNQSALAALNSSTLDVLRVKRTVYFEQKSATTAFTGVSTVEGSGANDSSQKPRAALELTPVQAVPIDLPVQYTVSPAALLAIRRG